MFNIKKARKLCGINQSSLAKRLDVTQVCISNWENQHGKNVIKPVIYNAINEATGYDTNLLFNKIKRQEFGEKIPTSFIFDEILKIWNGKKVYCFDFDLKDIEVKSELSKQDFVNTIGVDLRVYKNHLQDKSPIIELAIKYAFKNELCLIANKLVNKEFTTLNELESFINPILAE